MTGTLKKPESMYNIIFKAVTEGEDLKKTARECKKLFKDKKDPADPNVLIQLKEVLRARENEEDIAKHINLSKQGNSPKTPDELKESLKKQKEDYERYIQHFLPALLGQITQSTNLSKEKAKEIGRIISGITNKSNDKNHSSSTIQNQSDRRNSQTDRQGNAIKPSNEQSFSGEVPNSTSLGINPLERGSLAKGVSGTGISGTYNRLKSLSYRSASTTPRLKQSQERKNITQSQLNSQSDLSIDCKDSKNDSDSRINSSSLASSSRRNSLTSVTSISSEESVHLKLNPAEEDNSLQLEDEGKTKLAHPNKTRPKGPSGRRSPSKHYKKTEEGPHCVISVTGSKVKDTMQSNNYENNSKIKQLNNKNLHVALVTSSALLAIGCIFAGAMTSGLVGAGLFVVAAVFATAAAAEFCSNILSSKLISISVSPLVDNKGLTQ